MNTTYAEKLPVLQALNIFLGHYAKSSGTFYDAIRLDILIKRHEGNQDNKLKLQSFLKRVQVQVTHLAEKNSKAGESIPRVKTIYGFASKDDGHNLDCPPLVNKFGAGPENVKFFLNDSTGAPSSSSTDQATGNSGSKYTGKGIEGGASSLSPSQNVSQGGKYISVYEFFSNGICSTAVLLYVFVTN